MPAPRVSAGVLAYRRASGSVEFLLVHPGGPYWRNRDLGAWSLPKGLVGPGETIEAAARREFQEELGLAPPAQMSPLTPRRQPGGKIIHSWLTAADLDLDRFRSNRFDLEWPPRSGRTNSFPEVDRAAYVPAQAALARVQRGQAPILREALARLDPGAPA